LGGQGQRFGGVGGGDDLVAVAAQASDQQFANLRLVVDTG